MVVVYLTPRRTTAELGDSLLLYGDTAENRQRLFQLRWQDVVEAIDHTLRAADTPAVERLILTDVACFLRQRGLERFHGMNPNPYDGDLHADDGLFYRQGERKLTSFVLVDGLDAVAVVRGAWCHAD